MNPVRLLLLGFLFAPPAFCESAEKVLRVCNDIQDPPALDPQKEFAEKNHIICQQVFDGLVRFSPDGAVEPALAVSWQRMDPLRMRFSLRQGVHFHNGEPFDAESVRFTIQRYLDPKTGFPGIGFLGALDHAEVVDPGTVDIVTKYPDGLLLRRLAECVLVVPPKYLQTVGEAAFAKQPVGTGAFRFKSWSPGEQIALAANRDYWMAGYPKIDDLIFRFIARKDQIGELFNGKVDLLVDLPGTKTLDVQSHSGTEVRKGKTYYTVSPILRYDRGPLADRRVRQALNYATDRQELVRYDLLGNGVPIASLSLPGEEGHDPSIVPYAYDPKKATALLASAGYPKGFKLTAMVKDSAERTAKILAADWKRIGVRMDMDVMTETQMPEYFKNPKYDLGIGDLPDPMGHVYFIQSLLIYSKSPFSLAKDPKFDSMFEAMATTIDDKMQSELAKNLDRYIHDEALSIFTYQRSRIYGVRKGIRFDHYITGTPFFMSAEVPQ